MARWCCNGFQLGSPGSVAVGTSGNASSCVDVKPATWRVYPRGGTPLWLPSAVMDEVEVSPAEARRIAVRAQLLDGSATDVRSTVGHLGFLQLDPISTVAPPQHLVLWSRLGRAYHRRELDRLLWDERSLIEWNAYLWPAELLPALLARMHLPADADPRARWRAAFLAEHRAFRRYVLSELERRGPLLSRDIEDHRPSSREPHRWWGARKMGLMLQVLNAGGEVAVVGRQGNQRVWDL